MSFFSFICTKPLLVTLPSHVVLLLMLVVASSLSVRAEESRAASQPQSTQNLAPLRNLGQELNSDLVRKLTRVPKSEVSLMAFECGTVLVNNLGLFTIQDYV